MWSAQKSFAAFYNVFHTYSVLFVLSDHRKCMEELRFSKMQQFLCCQITENAWEKLGYLKCNKGLLCTPDLVRSFFKLIIYNF